MKQFTLLISGRLQQGIWTVLFIGGLAPLAAQSAEIPRVQKAEEVNYYRKWLDEDALYVITPDERTVFESLTTDGERDAFIEQFWFRRDPDPRTAFNEFKEEHYRRIAYANDHFYSGEPGWKTDRGEMYIKFGPPDGRETYPNGGPYSRKMSEGGGRTTVYPFERWRYNYIEGIGNNVEIEFVDPSRTGEYRIALSPQDKDSLLYVQTGGPGYTEGEQLGIEDRWMRITRDSGLGIQSRSAHYAIHPDDFPFERLQRLSVLQEAPQDIEFRDLKTEVNSLVTYERLPFQVAESFVSLPPDRFFVPITVAIENKELHYQRQSDGSLKSTVQIYGTITDLGRKVWAEFDQELVNRSAPSDLETELTRLSLYQKMVLLPAGRYRLEMFIKDPAGERIGVFQTALVLDQLEENSLSLSPVILADLIQPENSEPERFEQFTLGSLKVVPNVSRSFTRQDLLNIYLQAYNVHLDQSSLKPDLSIRYFVMDGGKLVQSFPDIEGRSINFVSPQRVVMTTAFRLEGFDPGSYNLLVRIRDNLSGQERERNVKFEVRK